MKKENHPTIVMKIDLSKAYNKSWYIRLILFHIGRCLPIVNWIMRCLTTVSFVVLINGLTS
jgi:hypothetical protein